MLIQKNMTVLAAQRIGLRDQNAWKWTVPKVDGFESGRFRTWTVPKKGDLESGRSRKWTAMKVNGPESRRSWTKSWNWTVLKVNRPGSGRSLKWTDLTNGQGRHNSLWRPSNFRFSSNQSFSGPFTLISSQRPLFISCQNVHPRCWKVLEKWTVRKVRFWPSELTKGVQYPLLSIRTVQFDSLWPSTFDQSLKNVISLTVSVLSKGCHQK